MGYGIELSNQDILIIGAVVFTFCVVIVIFGGYFSKYNKNINDFFYSGQRFSWWLPAASMIATGIGSYSYLKYSEQGYDSGMSSTMTYMNDWFLVPFFIFGWLPIIYYSRIKSIPEYFERRFNKTARYISLVIIMSYMLFYIGYNLYSIGVAMEGMFGFPQLYSVPVLALLLGTYVTFGGQTAVIFTDLLQGFMLYLAGAVTVFAGLYAMGGLTEWWEWLPITHRLPFAHLTADPQFNTSGLFWGEALAGSIAYAFMNQGFIMRYLTAKSVDESRKAGMFNVLVSLPIAAVIVGALGWIAKSIITKQAAVGGALEGLNYIHIENSFHTFVIICWETLQHNPLIFGFVVAALVAALMSTIDTLINACAALFIYDLYKPLIKPHANDDHYLKAARWSSIVTTTLGVLLVIWFNKQTGSLMSIHYQGIMIIIPAIVTTVFLGAFWRNFTPVAACCSMVIGSALTFLTIWKPTMIDFIAWFVSGPEEGSHIYLRALFGMGVSAVIGIVVSHFTKPKTAEEIVGLTIDTIDESMRRYKGGEINLVKGERLVKFKVQVDESLDRGRIELSSKSMEKLKAKNGDMLYIEEAKWYLGGLRSVHVKGYLNSNLPEEVVATSSQTLEDGYLSKDVLVNVEKIL